jgi:aromatic-L-amino-acid decarboxylase
MEAPEMTGDGKWEWSQEEIKRVGYQVVDLIAEHLVRLPDDPVFRPFPAELADRYLNSSVPESGADWDEILETFATEIAPFPFGNGHPRFYGWVNSPPTVISIFAEALAAAMNPSCAGGNHAAIYVERQVIDWFRQILGFPARAMGLLVSGGSAAALTALAAARQSKCGFDVRTLGLRGSEARMTFYRSGETHGCYQKAIELMGFGSEAMVTVESDSAMRMIPSALDRAITADRRDGRMPIAVIASAGTVNGGAIDPLAEIADVCERHDVWFHVDGAYGAPAILNSKYADALSAIARADSVALDPHKWLYIPVEAGLVLVREGSVLRQTFSLIPPYLQTEGEPEGVGGLPWFSEYGFQQTRAFRALKVWMALRHHGLAGYRVSIEKDLALAEYLTSLLKSRDDFEVFEPQSLSIVCFRYLPPGVSGDEQIMGSINREILKTIQLGGEAFISSTVMDNKFWLRACIVNPRANKSDIQALYESLMATLPRLGLRRLHTARVESLGGDSLPTPKPVDRR